MSLILPALMSIGLLAGCGGGLASTRSGTGPDVIAMQSEAVPAPRNLTPRNDRGVYTITVGRSVGLVVPDPHAPDPDVEGQSIRVVEVTNIDASGRREWELRAIKPGRTVLRAKGTHPYTITIDVQE